LHFPSKEIEKYRGKPRPTFESQSLKKEALQILIKSANQSLNQQLETKPVAPLYASSFICQVHEKGPSNGHFLRRTKRDVTHLPFHEEQPISHPAMGCQNIRMRPPRKA
jgi:hypothetical protein